MRNIYILILSFTLFATGCSSVGQSPNKPNQADLPVVSSVIKDKNEKNNHSEDYKGIEIPPDAEKYIENREILDNNLFTTKESVNLYDTYAKNKDDSLLSGLKPIDVLRLYNTAIEKGNIDVQISLTVLPRDIDKSKIIADIKNDKVVSQNDTKLISSYRHFKGLILERVIDEKSAYIFIQNNGWYRMQKDSKNNWKLSWLARQ